MCRRQLESTRQHEKCVHVRISSPTAGMLGMLLVVSAPKKRWTATPTSTACCWLSSSSRSIDCLSPRTGLRTRVWGSLRVSHQFLGHSAVSRPGFGALCWFQARVSNPGMKSKLGRFSAALRMMELWERMPSGSSLIPVCGEQCYCLRLSEALAACFRLLGDRYWLAAEVELNTQTTSRSQLACSTVQAEKQD
jgi:hypothetical protein